MANQAELVYEIDSASARTAATDLAKMNDAAARAAGGADKLNKTLRDNQGRFKSSAAVAKEYGGEVQSLAAKYNPALSAVYKYQQAQLELNRAVALGVVTQSQADAALSRVSAELQRTTVAANNYANGMRNVNNVQASVGNQFAQLNDVVVTAWGGMNPALIGMQQGMQMVQGFAGQSLPQALGTLRGAFAQLLNPVTLGTVALIAGGAALIQWGASALGAETNAKSFNETLNELEASTSRLTELANVYSTTGIQTMIDKYGELNAEILNHIELQRQVAIRDAMESSIAAINSLQSEMDGFFSTTEMSLQSMFNVGIGSANAMVTAMEKVKKSASFDEQVGHMADLQNMILSTTGGIDNMTSEQYKFFKAVSDSLDQMRLLEAAAPKASWMNAAISGVESLGAAIRARIGEASRLAALANAPGMTTGDSDWYKNSLGFTLPGNELIPDAPRGGSGASGSGGGGGVDQARAAWDALNEVQYQGVLKNLETLKWGLDQKLISEQEYNKRRAEMLALEFGTESQQSLVKFTQELATLNAQFEQKLIAEEAYLMRRRQLQWDYIAQADSANASVFGQELSNWGAHFGQMNQLAGGGYDGLLRLQRSFAAASALINTWKAYTDVLASGEVMSPWAKLAWGGKILAAGLGAVNAIKGGGGGGSSAASSAPATRSEPQRNILVRLEGPSFMVDMAEEIMTQIYDQSRDGRVVISRDR